MSTSCIITTYARQSQGYGNVWRDGKQLRHHRLVYCEHNKISLESIEGMLVRHTCDNPSCVNPAHLVLGTAKDNAADRTERNRWKGGQPKALSSDQIAEILANPGTIAQVFATKFNVAKSTVNLVRSRRGAYATGDHK